MFSFVFKSVHLALVALKDEQIKSMRDELSVARTDRLRAEASRDAAITRAFDLLTPKVPELARFPARQPIPAPPTLDLSLVDPSDNNAIYELALAEMPSGKANANLLINKMEKMRKDVYAAIAAKSERAKEIGTLPQTVNDQIDAAIEKGKQQARTQ